MSKFFINRPIVAIVISIVMVLVGVAHHPELAGGAVSQHHSARDSSAGHLCRRGRANPGTSGCHAHRAADERRGQHELHVLAECHRQFHHQPDRGLRRKDRSKHRLHSHPVAAKPRPHRSFRSTSPITESRFASPSPLPSCGSPFTRRTEPTMPSFWPTTRTSTSLIPSCVRRASATCRSSAPANTRCGFG